MGSQHSQTSFSDKTTTKLFIQILVTVAKDVVRADRGHQFQALNVFLLCASVDGKV